MRETVVVLSPDMRGKQVVQRGNLPPPRQVRRDLQPLGVLVEHRINDVDERLVAIEQSMSPGQQVAFKPAFALVFAQHRIQHASVAGEKFVVRQSRGVPLALGHLEKRFEAVGESFVRAENTKVPLLAVQLRHIAQERTEHMDVANAARPGRGNVFRIAAVIRHLQVAEQNAAVGVGIRAHASFAFGCEFGQFRFQAARLIKQFLWPIAPQPVFQKFEMFWMRGRIGERHLMRAKGSFHLQAIHELRPGPAFG